MGKNNLKLSTKRFFSSFQHKKPHGRGAFPFSFLCVFYISCWAGEVDSHPHLPGRPQLQVRSSHHGSAANIFPLIIFAQYSILQIRKEGRASNTWKRCLLLKRIIQKNCNSELIKPHISSTEVFWVLYAEESFSFIRQQKGKGFLPGDFETLGQRLT